MNADARAERQEWITTALRGVASLAAEGRPFQAHDLVLLRGVPEPPHHNFWGVMMGIAHSEGIVVPIAATPSTRPKTAKSLVRMWIGAQHARQGGAA